MASYLSKIKEKDNLVFGLIWGVISVFIAGALTQILNGINAVMDFLMKIIIYGLSLPGWLGTKIPFLQGSLPIKIVLAVAIALLLAPPARFIFNLILKIFKRSPI